MMIDEGDIGTYRKKKRPLLTNLEHGDFRARVMTNPFLEKMMM
jgi:hypothetical protein